jgi:hypothetical protein
MSPPHIAAWGDLDAHGIAIITDPAARLGRQVHAIGMEPELFRNGTKRIRTETERQEARDLTARLATTAHEPLRPLTALIAASGDSREQQTIRAQVTPHLGTTLRVIEAAAKSPDYQLAQLYATLSLDETLRKMIGQLSRLTRSVTVASRRR